MGSSFILITNESIAFPKKLLNEFETFNSSEIISHFSTNNFISKVLTLSKKNGLKQVEKQEEYKFLAFCSVKVLILKKSVASYMKYLNQ